MAASCIALNAALSSRVDGWRIDGMDRWIDGWMDEWMAGRTAWTDGRMSLRYRLQGWLARQTRKER